MSNDAAPPPERPRVGHVTAPDEAVRMPTHSGYDPTGEMVSGVLVISHDPVPPPVRTEPYRRQPEGPGIQPKAPVAAPPPPPPPPSPRPNKVEPRRRKP